MPYFSVIIPTFNRYIPVKRAIDSVLSQNFKDFELIVIDDGSTDDTEKLKNDYPGKLTYLKQKNCGVSSARNSGIKKSRGKYIAFLDSDDVWLRNKLEKHYNYIKNNHKIRIHQTDEIWIRHGKKVNKKNKHNKKDGKIFIESLQLCLISPSAVAMDCALFDEFGFFDESMRACEDYDLWLRITSNESIGLINEKLVVRYGGHKDQLSNKFWGMDSFRIYSIIKLLEIHGNYLSKEYFDEAKKTVVKKFKILLNGSNKRGKSEYADKLEKMIDLVNDGCYNRKYYSTLLKK